MNPSEDEVMNQLNPAVEEIPPHLIDAERERNEPGAGEEARILRRMVDRSIPRREHWWTVAIVAWAAFLIGVAVGRALL